jgi:DNA-directed RNA polymerase III subunit RPC11
MVLLFEIVQAWENVDQTDASCPFCENKRAFYIQIQIRSADEPMTVFYKCTKCKKTWNSN